MKITILKFLVLTFLIGLWLFSLFELYNLSALYKDQIDMGEFALSTKIPQATKADYIDLQKQADEINLLRIIFLIISIGLPLIAISKTIFTVIKDKKANR